MALSFGTDGVRGVAFTQLTEDFVYWLGRAAGEVLDLPRWVVGRDTRESGPALLAALASGAGAAGVEVVDLGVIPTPAVAHLAAAERCGGAMISASHNPWADNGIKLFAAGGLKLSDETQAAVEARLDELLGAGPRPTSAGIARMHERPHHTYLESVAASIEGRRLTGLSVVLDCANGAASTVAPEVFRDLGAEVTVLHAAPDGRNINHECGSTHPEALQAAVRRLGADLGLAFDGDADRLIGVDSEGELIDGDRLMAMFAVDLRARGALSDDTLVITVMSNLGLRRAMTEAGVQLHETPVGDRHVLEALDASGYDLGGEQSGHLIFRRLATTGDGILCGVLFADLLVRTDSISHQLSSDSMVSYPQVLLNVVVKEQPADVSGALADVVAAAEARLGADGRVLVRPSGTEPLIRVMVEALTDDLAADVAAELASVVETRFG